MASSTLTLYDENSGTTIYALQSTSAQKTRYAVTGRSLAKPKAIEIERKFAPNNSSANDHIIVRVIQTEQSTLSPFKLSSFTASLDISIPRDLTGFTGGTTADLLKRISNLVSALNNNTACAVANSANTGLNLLASGGDL
jgi:hypothetical protein